MKPDNCFYIPKHGKIRESVMVNRMFATVGIIVFCLFAMSISAYAYFSHDLTSSSNGIQSANFGISISIDSEESDAIPPEIVSGKVQTFSATLEPGFTYRISIKRSDSSTAKTGFCIIQAEGSDQRYHTIQLGVDALRYNNECYFYLNVNETTKLNFLAHWGTSSYYGYQTEEDPYIESGDIINLVVNVPGNPNDLTDNSPSDSVSTDISSTDISMSDTGSSDDGSTDSSSAGDIPTDTHSTDISTTDIGSTEDSSDNITTD